MLALPLILSPPASPASPASPTLPALCADPSEAGLRTLRRCDYSLNWDLYPV